MDVPVEDVDTGLLGAFVVGVFVVAVTDCDEDVLLVGEETGTLGDVAVVDAGVNVEVGETGDGDGEDGAEDTGAGDNGVLGGGKGGVEVEVEVGLGDGLRVVVVLDPPVIVNCGLALPESPNRTTM